MKLKCETCTFWEADSIMLKSIPLLDGQTKLGFCRKHYPIVFPVKGFYYTTSPTCDIDLGCGEYRGEK